MRTLFTGIPALDYLNVMLQTRIARARELAQGEDRQLGASAVEWVVITVIVLVITTGISVVIYNAVNTEKTNINNCITSVTGGSSCKP